MARKITNKHNLPDSIVRAVTIDNHKTFGDISVTQLIDAPQIRILRKKNDVEEDVMDLVWSLYGTAMHHILEMSEITTTEARAIMHTISILENIAYHKRTSDPSQAEELGKASTWLRRMVEKIFPGANDPDIMLEKNLTIDVFGMTISGTMDWYRKSQKKLRDYKNCGTYAYMHEESRKKWIAQLNVYAYMLREHGFEVDDAEIIALFRDWHESDIVRNRNYPKYPIMPIPIKLYSQEQMKTYIETRVRLHQAAELGEVIECTGEERWATADQFAVKVKGGMRAKKILATRQQAEYFIKTEGINYVDPYIEERPGDSNRCAKFCPVRNVCPQRKKELEKIANATTGGIE